MLIFTVSLILMSILFTLTFILPTINIHKNYDREKTSPFECGFDPFSKSRISFSIHFFSIMLMFLIFDIEITIIIPLPISLEITSVMTWVISLISLLLILILGMIMEWKEGSMNWK